MSALREHWQLVLLAIVLVVSGFVLVSPTMAPSPDASGTAAVGGVTNLQYGLDLAGGTRVRAPLDGLTAEGVDLEGRSARELEIAVAAELDAADAADLTVRSTPESATVEVTAPEVTPDAFAAALSAVGLSDAAVREGVTEATRAETIRVLEQKINEAGLSGGTVQEVRTGSGEYFILIEIPDADTAEVRALVETQGKVVVRAYHPTAEGYAERVVLEQADFQSIGSAQEGSRGGPYVPVTVTESAAVRFEGDMVETGLAAPGGTTCTYDADPQQTEACLLLVVDDAVTNSFGMSPGLAESLRAGTWSDNAVFQLQTRSIAEAQTVAINLRAGALPAQLDFSPLSGGTISYISPDQGAEFRLLSLIAGIFAVLAVSGAIFARYREVRVAAPMLLTAMSELIILLGFAAGVGYPLDLAVIAGFIAVVGTGVDDLVIIADEILTEGGVESRRVFASRFRRAFWVIGVAAATTIVAMAPLAVLSLGDLRGFAIFTIIGVLVGVLITRPAYGEILRILMTTDR